MDLAHFSVVLRNAFDRHTHTPAPGIHTCGLVHEIGKYFGLKSQGETEICSKVIGPTFKIKT